MSTDGQGTKCRRNIAENFNRLSRVQERYTQTTDDRQTKVDRQQMDRRWYTGGSLKQSSKCGRNCGSQWVRFLGRGSEPPSSPAGGRRYKLCSRIRGVCMGGVYQGL